MLELKLRPSKALVAGEGGGEIGGVCGIELLFGSGDEFGGGGSGALLGAAFLFDVLGAVGDFVVDGFDFAGEVEILRIP
jgi:hypothetical protein